MAQLSKGCEYDVLKKQYVIFIFPFDPAGDNLFVYTYKKDVMKQDKMQVRRNRRSEESDGIE